MTLYIKSPVSSHLYSYRLNDQGLMRVLGVRMREVWGSNPGPAKSYKVKQFAIASTSTEVAVLP